MNANFIAPEILALVPAGGHTTFLDNFSYQIAGLAVVILSLGALAGVVQVVGKLINLSLAKAKPAPAPSQPEIKTTAPESPTPTREAPEVEGRIPAETLAVISAAVAVAVPQAHRIVQIRPQPNPWLQAWSLEGRRQIFQSHRTR